MNDKTIELINNKIDFVIIGHNATSYKLPLIVDSIKEYQGKICIDCKNIKGKYIVFDKDTFFDAVDTFRDSLTKKETR
jgi:hypothetical protein